MTGRRPRRAAASATARGKLPPPQMMAIAVPDTGGASKACISVCILAALLAMATDTWAHQRPFPPCANERNDLFDQWIVRKVAGNSIHALGEYALAEEQLPIGPPHSMQVGARGTAPLQTDNIEASKIRNVAESVAEGDQVSRDARESGHHRTLAYPRELMNRCLPAKEGVVADLNVSAEHRVIGKGDAIADFAVVADMGAHHEQAMLAHIGHASAILGASIHGHPFA
jgi:hypothetical protein